MALGHRANSDGERQMTTKSLMCRLRATLHLTSGYRCVAPPGEDKTQALRLKWLLGFLFALHLVKNCACKQEIRARCLAPDSDVARIVLRVGSGLLIDDGAICRCVDGPNTLWWDEENTMSLTWYHHERIDWLVQYQFCTTKSRKRPCLLEDDVAVVIRSPKDSWDPKLLHWRCSCLNGRYYMDSWLLQDNDKPEKQFWEYRYSCDKRPCDVGEPCVRHYLNRAASQTIGFKFLCTCPHGRLCQPSKEGRPQAYEADGHEKNIGPYILRYCSPIPGWDRPPWK